MVLRIGILFGGNSLEHEISIISAFQLKKKLESRYQIVMLYVDFDNNLYYSNKAKLKEFKNKKLKTFKKTKFMYKKILHIDIDLIILSCHGEHSEDGTFSAICDFYNIKYIGANMMSSGIFLDKYYSYLLLKEHNFKVLDTYKYTYNDYINGISITNYPAILKPIKGGSSIGIILVNSNIDFENKINIIFNSNREYIVQEYHSNLLEFNLSISKNYISNLEIINKKDSIFSFKNKYNESFKQLHQRIDNERISEFENIGRRLYDTFNLSGIIRIDFFLIDNEIYVNEVNTIPGALAMYLYDDFDKVIDDEINISLNTNMKKYSLGNYIKNNNINK